MATRMLRVEITGSILPLGGHTLVPPGTYLATEIRQPPAPAMAGAIALLAEPLPVWRLRKLDPEGRPLPSGPAFVLSFRELAEHIGAKHMRVIEGDFV